MSAALLSASLLLLAAVPLLVARPGTRLSATRETGLWLATMLLRAAVTVFVAVLLFVVVPTTTAFESLTSWCAHVVVPLLTTQLGIEGHRLGDVAITLPAVLIALGAAAALVATLRATRAVKRWLRDDLLGPGPQGSLMVAGAEVFVAAVGFRRPQVVVSAGALVRLDEDELRAGLAHERGHIVRGHRFILLCARALLGLARPLPGGKASFARMCQALERDADQYAVRQTGAPAALANAISKAASPALGLRRPPELGVSQLAGSGVDERLDVLDARAPDGGSGLHEGLASLSTLLATALAVALLASLPGLAAGSEHDDPRSHTPVHIELR